MCICVAPCREHTSKALRSGTHSEEISQFYLHTSRSSANRMNHTCLPHLNQKKMPFNPVFKPPIVLG